MLSSVTGIGTLTLRSAASQQFRLGYLMAPLSEDDLLESLYFKELQRAVVNKEAVLGGDISFELGELLISFCGVC